MDKSWTLLDDRRLEAYEVGCQAFLDYAFVHSAIDGQIRCPCKNCRNKKFGDREFVHYHLLFRGIDKQYGSHLWVFHNEKEEVIANCVVSDKLGDSGFRISENGGDMDEMLRACLNPYVDSDHLGNDDSISESSEFFKLIKEANTPLYDDCKDFSKLSFIIELYQIKSRGKMSDAAFSDILELLKKAFPFITVPKNFYETKKLISKLGCGYTKIDACENDCILFWKDDKDLDKCRVCNSSRWKPQRQGSRTRVSKNILRHFPLIPRLQRLFMSKKSAKDMKWHSEQRSEDGHLRHPADSSAWKDFDRKHQLFASDIRNVRLGLASDGFNPFGTLSTMYSTWPVLLFVYNLPPAMCMKQSNIIMSLLISGSKGPKNAIDVYLQPLMDELKELWGPGVRTLDTSTGKRFDMRAALIGEGLDEHAAEAVAFEKVLGKTTRLKSVLTTKTTKAASRRKQTPASNANVEIAELRAELEECKKEGRKGKRLLQLILANMDIPEGALENLNASSSDDDDHQDGRSVNHTTTVVSEPTVEARAAAPEPDC